MLNEKDIIGLKGEGGENFIRFMQENTIAYRNLLIEISGTEYIYGLVKLI